MLQPVNQQPESETASGISPGTQGLVIRQLLTQAVQALKPGAQRKHPRCIKQRGGQLIIEKSQTSYGFYTAAIPTLSLCLRSLNLQQPQLVIRH